MYLEYRFVDEKRVADDASERVLLKFSLLWAVIQFKSLKYLGQASLHIIHKVN